MSETLERPAAETAAEVLYEAADGIATITLNRPERMNAISGPMLARLSELLLKANADPKVRVVILTGAGRAFCVGLDLVDATQGSGIGSEQSAAAPSVNLDLKTAPPTVLFAMDKPTICALNGAAAGYGMDTALGCDIRIMGESSKLAAAFVKRGVVPESGGTWILPRLLGWAKAAEVIFTGRTLSAAESLALGLANEVVPDAELMARARAVAAEIAANAPLAVQSAKRLMRMGMAEGFNDHVHHVYLQFLQLVRTQDFREGMTSFLEKRPADFQGR
ncbi:enoyl-CoA hydratase/isomerase family protein [Phenylobacterium sp.]|jgi:enoyl-CoA hydratase/carnithine racemase|uniref:enoyl-CoA hydratase/isomerase family protein n=1 Tax=Phenylobacterium sp. TaxID=1871053 RepID=UPI002E35E08B|nr:enoyl-CoA hydratase-related protein [Phenylobacterium sp.]HEX3364004.1 enoyl-CoA hydratase-related protein [Phenylobacterium sp.]